MSHAHPHPWILTPIAVPRPWGGARCRALGLPADVKPPPDQPIGEWWLVSARDEYPSIVSHGPDAGRSLPELLRDAPRAVLGPHAPEEWFRRFPLLIKILDAAETLSVQVHPNDTSLAGDGKTESWYVLDAAKDAELYLGLRPGTDVEAFYASDDPVVELARLPAHAGQLIHLPAGLLHSLGAGVVALEIQQNSDTTYRIHDWGRGRELHLEQARAVTLRTQEPILPVPSEVQTVPFHREVLVQCEHYVLERLRVEGTVRVDPVEHFAVLVPLRGASILRVEGFEQPLTLGHAALVPGGGGSLELECAGDCELIRVLPLADR